MMFGCGVQNPLVLILIPIILAIVCILLILRDRERLRRTNLLGAEPIDTPRWRLWCIIAASLLSLSGVSRPYCGMEQIEVPTTSTTRIFVIDVSRSMFTRDVQPSRIGLGKRKLRDYINESARAGVQERIGIVLFAGSSYLFCPVTDDHLVLSQFLDSISPELITALGSNIESGLRTAVIAFSRARVSNPSILLVSDGEDPNQKGQDEIIKLLQSRNVTVDVLALGTAEGKPIELNDGKFLRDNRNEIVVSRLEGQFLKRVADETKGVFAVAGISNTDIESIVQRVKNSLRAAALAGTGQSSTITTYGEFGFLLIIPGCVLFALAIAPRGHGLLLRSLLFMAFFTYSPVTVSADEPPAIAAPSDSQKLNARDGFLAYQRGDYRSAKDALTRAHTEYPRDLNITQALASTLYQLGDFMGAEALFQELREKASTGKARYENSFNLGNARYMQDNMEGAISAYESALRTKPDDVAATNNLTLAKKRLQQKKMNPTPTPTVTGTASASATPTNQAGTPTPSGSPTSAASASASPTAESSPSPGGTPTESSDDNATPNPDGGQGSPTAEPSKSRTTTSNDKGDPNGTPTPLSAPSTPSPEPAPSPGTAPRIQTPDALQTPDSKGMSQKEADLWLDSLPDSPLLLRRSNEPSHSSGQTW